MPWFKVALIVGFMTPLPAATAIAEEQGLPTPAPIPTVAEWRSALGQDHVLAGRIWNPREKQFVEEAALISRMQSARFLLLGEKHDNEDHHRLQAWVVGMLLAKGRRPAVALEMFDTDQSDRLSRHLSDHPKDAAGIGSAVGWEQSGWSDWSIYAPIVQAALDAGTPVLPANLPRSTIKSIAKEGVGALDPAQVSAWRLQEPLSGDVHARMRQDIIESHCNMLPERMVEPMVTVLRSRDAFMASVLINGAGMAGADAAVLISGGGHVRTDHGVPWHLRRLVPSEDIVSLAFLEVREGEADPEAYAALFNSAELPFDYVWFTPRVDDADPCEKHAEELQRVK